MTNERFAEFFDKYQRGILPAAERQELDEWIAQSDFNRETFERITNEDTLKQALNEEANARINNWTKIVKEYPELASEPAPVVAIYKEGVGRIRRYVAVAASLLVIALGAYLWLKPVKKQPEEIVATPKEIKNDVLPDTKNAVLTLDDGTTIILDSIQSGLLATQGTMTIEKQKDGVLRYSGKGTATSEKLIYNKVTVPKGSDVVYLQLLDGSKVWLNAESSIRYPVAFGAEERKVEITGEAYFEVAPLELHSHPSHGSVAPEEGEKKRFIVSKGDINVVVLGTKFNVNSYENEDNIKVTLLEGIVRVVASPDAGGRDRNDGAAPGNGVVIKPGQQAVLDGKDIKVISDANISQVMAWKNGKFIFKKTNIQVIMRQMERWYDLDPTQFEGEEVKQFGFNGEISRYSNASKVIELLEKTGTAKFKIEGKKIIVAQQ